MLTMICAMPIVPCAMAARNHPAHPHAPYGKQGRERRGNGGKCHGIGGFCRKITAKGSLRPSLRRFFCPLFTVFNIFA